MCYQWAHAFWLQERRSKSDMWDSETRGAEKKTDKSGGTHFWAEFTACGKTEKSECKILVDDGYFDDEGEMIHQPEGFLDDGYEQLSDKEAEEQLGSGLTMQQGFHNNTLPLLL